MKDLDDIVKGLQINGNFDYENSLKEVNNASKSLVDCFGNIDMKNTHEFFMKNNISVQDSIRRISNISGMDATNVIQETQKIRLKDFGSGGFGSSGCF